MQALTNAVLPVFGIVLIGWLAARTRFMGEPAIDGLSRFVFNFAVPLLLFRSVARAGLPEHTPWGLLLAFYGAALAVLLLGFAAGRLLFGRGPMESVSYGATAAYGNTVLMGIPIVLMTYGEVASLPLFVIMGVHTLVMVPMVSLAYAFAGGRGRGLKGALGDMAGDLARNPILIALILGLLYARLAPPLPRVADEIARLLGETAMPAALFAIGGTLARYSIGGQVKHALMLSAAKLAVFPALVWLLADRALGLPDLWVQVAVLLAAMPCGVTAFLFATRYDAARATVTTSVVLSAALAVITLPAAIWLTGGA